ncbi:MAG: N-acetyltransferase [Rhodospirillales bacterium]
MYHIEEQTPRHDAAIDILLDAAFGPNRHAKRSYGFRDGIDDIDTLRFVAIGNEDGDLVGTIRFWPVRIGMDGAPALLLGPLGVSPDHQGEGIGAALIDHGLAEARSQGFAICTLVGPLHYYGRFGFAPASIYDVAMPGEAQERLLIRELRNDALKGVSGDIRRWDPVADVAAPASYSAASA